MHHRPFVKSLSLVALVVMLSGCGGGGGGGGGGENASVPATTAPTVLSVTPAHNATDVATSTTVSINFSETIDCATVTTSTFAIAAGSIVAGTPQCAGSTVTFTPAADLAFATTYTVIVSAEMKDSTGNALGGFFISRFTTAAAPSAASYTVGGTVSGLGSGKSVVLRNNGTDDLTVSTNGNFTFATPIANGAAYNVSVLIQPDGQVCTVSNGSGLVSGADITNTTMVCRWAADVLIVLDTSGRMGEEALEVQRQLNGFVSTIRASGIDLNLVLIAASGGICAPAPLGSGACPDDQNLPGYRHVTTAVGSTNALSQILATYSQWSASLRPGSQRTIIVISDDESGMTAQSFTTQLLALDPTFAGYRFNSIVATLDPVPNPANVCTSIASARGAQYIDLSTSTGGVVANLCEQDFGPAFGAMAMAVIDGFL